MANPLFERHEATLQQALNAIRERGYWTPYPETPSPKIYGEAAADEGRTRFEALLGSTFDFPASRLPAGLLVANVRPTAAHSTSATRVLRLIP